MLLVHHLPPSLDLVHPSPNPAVSQGPARRDVQHMTDEKAAMASWQQCYAHCLFTRTVTFSYNSMGLGHYPQSTGEDAAGTGKGAGFEFRQWDPKSTLKLYNLHQYGPQGKPNALKIQSKTYSSFTCTKIQVYT